MASGDTLYTFLANDASPPATNYATFDIIVGGSAPAEQVPVIAFDDTAAENIDFYGYMASNYTGGGVTATVIYAGASSTGVLDWEVAFRRLADDAESVAGAQTYDFNDTVDSVPTSVSEFGQASITFTNGADMDSVVAGDFFIMRIRRDITPNSGTNMTGDGRIAAVQVRET